MFYRFKGIELVYSFCGHLVLLTWFAIFMVHVCSAQGQVWLASTLRDDPVLAGVLCVAFLSFTAIFSFAMLCSIAVLMQFFGHYELAHKLYKLTLQIRQRMPLIGSTARIDVWRISIANCLRAQGKFAEAEELYKSVLSGKDHDNPLDRITNYGLKDVARENYATLLEASGRQGDADEMRMKIGKSAKLMRLKYLAVSAAVLFIGAGFAYLGNQQLTALIRKHWQL